MKQACKGVITGDIAGSSEIGEPAKLVRSLELLFGEIEQSGHILPGMWQIFKGDSFQVVCEPEQALNTALLIRSGLIGGVYTLFSPFLREDVLSQQTDARLGIGIGKVESLDSQLSRAFGEAFTRSGKLLQEITGSSLRLLFATGDEKLDLHFVVVSRLVDVLVGDWTANSAQAVYRTLLTGDTQKEVAGWLGITQPSVQHRLSIARIEEIRQVLSYFSVQMGNFTPE